MPAVLVSGALGVTQGERVAIMGDPCEEWMVCDLAAQALGAADVAHGHHGRQGQGREQLEIGAGERLGLADAFGNSRIPLYVLNVTYPLVDAEVVRFCAGKNTPTPDPAQRCFDSGAPTCLRCGGLLEPCCFDGTPAPRVDFARLVEALGVKPERIRLADPYELPTFLKVLREEMKAPEPSVIITTRPCVLTPEFERRAPLRVVDDQCNGCARCFADCPYAAVTMQSRSDGKNLPREAVVDSDLCAGCGICAGACPSSTPFRSVVALATGIDMPKAPIDALRAELEAALARLIALVEQATHRPKPRHKTREVGVGGLVFGGQNPVWVQSMTAME